MRGLTKREKIIALLCGAACVVFIGKQLFFERFFDSASDLEDRINVTARKITQAKALVKRQTGFDERLRELLRQIGVVTSESADMSGFTSEIENVARQAAVRVVNIQPQSVRQEKYYVVYPIEAALEGDWISICKFIHLLQSSEAALNLDELSLRKNSEETTVLQGQLSISVIRLKKPQ